MRELGPFRLVRVLGRGGTATAWEAVSADGPPVCVKLLDRSAERAGVEARLVASLGHPHIIPVLDLDLSGSPPWLAMPLARGGSLADATPTGPRVHRWARQLLEALAHAHARHVLHLDIKPANVLLAEADPDGPVWLADFGIGTRTGLDAGPAKGVGTPRYLAPEQLPSHRAPVGVHTDLFGLGCCLLALLTGGRPDPEPGRRWQQAARIGDPDWRAWLGGLLAPDPRDRFRHAAHALAGLPDAPPMVEGPKASWAQEETATVGFTAEVPEATVLEPASAPARPAPASAPAPGAVPSRELPTVLADRVAEPVPVAHASHLRLFSVRALPMVGRAEVRRALLARAADLRRRPGWLALTGVRGASTDDVGRWLCEVVREVGLARAIGDQPGLTGRGLAGRVEWSLRSAGLPDEAFLDRLAEHLGLPRPETWRVAAAVRPGLDVPVKVGTVRERVAALLPWVEALVRDEPLLLFAGPEDAREVARLERRLARARPRLPVLTVLLGPVDDLGLDPERGEVVEVPALSPAEGRRLLEHVLPMEASVGEGLYRLTGGDPGLLAEVLRLWVARGALVGGPHGLRLAPGRTLRLPSDLTGVPRERLELALGGSARLHLALAVQWGSCWTLSRWLAAAPEARRDQVAVLARRLQGANLVTEAGAGLAFASPLVRAAAEELSAPHRHEAALACLAVAERDPGVDAGSRGRLLAAAGRHAEAVDVLSGAVTDPRAFTTTMDQLDLLDRAMASASAAGLELTDPVLQRAAQRRASVLVKRGRQAEAARLAEEVLAAGATGNVAAGALRVLAELHSRTGETDRARQALRRVFALDGVDAEPMAWARALGASLAARAGDRGELRRHVEALQAIRPATPRVLAAVGQAAHLLAKLEGDLQGRLRWVELTREAAAQVHDTLTEGAACLNLADCQARIGDLEAAESWCLRARALLESGGADLNVALCDLNRAMYALRRGDPQVALASASEGWSSLRALGASHYLAVAEILRAEARQGLGDTERWREDLSAGLARMARHRIVDRDVLRSLEAQRAAAPGEDLPALDAEIDAQRTALSGGGTER
jgi:eukaryotic-like serine/threonine-protein kinase